MAYLKNKTMAYPVNDLDMNTGIWNSDLDLQLPIDKSQIDGFQSFINWNGFKSDHTAYDFAAYLNKNQETILGLPSDLNIHAIANGNVRQIITSFGDNYHTRIHIEHGNSGSGMFSSYAHVVPLVEENSIVKKGQLIARIFYEKKQQYGRLSPHLHFQLSNGRETKNRLLVDPIKIFPHLNDYIASPQGERNFETIHIEHQ
jgi:murein DD-endopeptidase MepM/ murein hydrolase activator NlpD